MRFSRVRPRATTSHLISEAVGKLLCAIELVCTLALTSSSLAAAASAGSANRFQGHLILGEERPGGIFEVLRDDLGEANAYGGAARHLPPFDFTFVQSGNAIIPVRRGAISGTHPIWEYILEPGTVSGGPGGAYSQATIPFTLEERNANCMHNGTMRFSFRSDGAVSDVAYRITAETCLYFKFNMSGSIAARYVPAQLPDTAAIIARYNDDVAHRMPLRPIQDLAIDYPGIDPNQFGSPFEVKPEDMTVYGVIVNGIHYVGGCNSRDGVYPFCAQMDLPSYSVAKSIFAGLESMRLSYLRPHAMASRIADYVPECAVEGSWGDVTFGNMLDMASGHYRSADYMVDEDEADMRQFLLADDHATRIAFACDHYPHEAKPGTVWVYHTPDSYLLGTAIRAFYESRMQTSSDFYHDLLVAPLWHPLHLDPAIDVVRRTYDSVAQPLTGYGMTLHSDDIAKLSVFLNVNNGQIGGRTVLDETMLAGALQRNPRDPGLNAGGPDYRYNNGFWAWNAQSFLGCKSPAWIPFMSGYGGITIAMMPNGVTYYYVSDGGSFAWARAAAESNKIKPFCKI